MATTKYADYGNISQVQQTAIQLIFDSLKEAFGNAISNTQDKVTVCDYGAADGMNSLPFIKCFQEMVDGQELVWICNDLPGNNFQSLFIKCYNWIAENIRNGNQVYILASGKSFYSQVAPTNTVNFGICLTAIHWLSKRPVITPGIDYQTYRQLIQDVGADDWKNFLLYRGQEMKEGGRLVVSVPTEMRQDICPNEHGKFIGLYGFQSVVTNMHQSLLITQEEYAGLWFLSVAHRTEEEICAPFLDPSIQEIGLNLVSLKRHHIPDISLNEWQANGGHKNATATNHFVDGQVSFLRSIASLMLPRLDGGRSLEEKHNILDAFFKMLRKEIMSDPYKYTTSWTFAFVEIEKHGSQVF